MRMKKGVKIVIEDWLKIKKGERLLIITDSSHLKESALMKEKAEEFGAFVAIIVIPKATLKIGSLLDNMMDFLLSNDVIVGATNYSLITTAAIREVVKHGIRYLSLPLSSNYGRSILSFSFLSMDPEKAEAMALRALPHINAVDELRLTTPRGTDIIIGKKGRQAGYFNGMSTDPGDIASSSFEIYIGIEETKTRGTAVLDGSLGYIGVPVEPTELQFENGRLVKVEQTETGILLEDYLKSFDDPGMYVAGELGIGLNTKSRCIGHSYIEDESAYGTFHLGMGRNLSLGGVHEAKGHFDLVFLEPTIYAGDVVVMKNGEMVV